MKKTKIKQTALAAGLVVLVSFGLIYALQKFVSLDGFKDPTTSPNAVIPKNGPHDGSGASLVDSVEDVTKLSPEERCQRIEDAEGKLNCFDNIILKEVVASNMLLACNDLKYPPNVQYCQDIFYKNKALLDSDIAVCKEIKDQYIRTQCEDSLNLRISVRDSSLESCNAITDQSQKNNCIDKVALKSAITTGDAGQCRLLSDESLKTICVSKANKQANSANYAQALKEGNPTLCNNLTDPLRTECQDAVNYNLGVEKNDVVACNKILESVKKEECVANVYLAQAKEANDPSICLKIGDTEKQTSCAQTVNVLLLKSALTSNDVAKCASISDATLKQKCQDSF